MRPLIDVLLTRDTAQRLRLSQTLLAAAVLVVSVMVMQFYVWTGVVAAVPALLWSVVNVLGMMGFYGAQRMGWTRALAEPSLTAQQILFAVTSIAAAYALAGPARGGVFPALMLVMVFGVFALAPRQMLAVVVYAVLLFAVVMAVMVNRRPDQYLVAVEIGHFVMLSTMLAAGAVLSVRITRLRLQSKQHRIELAQALLRLRESSSRDELTGLVNKRQMQALMEQEHQRCIRSGQTFCLAVLDVDNFKPINEAHGYAVGDAVLRAVAEEAQRQVRAADVLSRWVDDDFVLMMSDSRAALARGGLERLHERVSALRILHGQQALSVTLSAGLAEHHAGESVAQTLTRAERALAEARTQGRGRVVVAA
jgi:diguanylate cyclase (GGDEF)-like protein